MDSMLESALESLDVATLGYDEWLEVGMALHEIGEPCSTWDEWSRNDKRYKDGVCYKRWQSFGRGSGGDKVKAGTIIDMARKRGWEWSGCEDRAYGWDDDIYVPVSPTRRLIDSAYIDSTPIAEPDDKWDGRNDLKSYLADVFEPGDKVSFVMTSTDDGRPASKGFTLERDDAIERLGRFQMDEALCKPDDVHGGWIRFNPMDGQGAGNRNVTKLRHTLIESDSTDMERQLAIIKELKLPVSAIVSSGGKSIHAIVRVDAENKDEYRERVEKLYQACRENGLEVDAQNKNESRLSRMPGLMRNGRKQFLIARAGADGFCKSWAEWLEWYDNETDALPDLVRLEDVFDNPPDLADEVISGVLRRGHKMLIAGPSKAGKSFALIELCVAVATGCDWLGFHVAKGKVMYVNLELDDASCINRFVDVSREIGYDKAPDGITILNLRGRALPLNQLVKPIERRAMREQPDVIIIDPLYKVLTGDENSASEMAAFCNCFDALATSTGCSVVYCHHHSKGDQTGKTSMDRASGSGVFARDPDALLDLLEVTDDNARAIISRDLMADGLDQWDAEERAEQATVWEISGTLREFKSFKPRYAAFLWPVHTTRWDAEIANARTAPKPTKAEQKRKENDALLESTVEFMLATQDSVSVSEVAAELGMRNDVAARKIRALGYPVEKSGPRAPNYVMHKIE